MRTAKLALVLTLCLFLKAFAILRDGLIYEGLTNGSLLDLAGSNGLGVLTAGASKGFVRDGIGVGCLDFDGVTTRVVTSAITQLASLQTATFSVLVKAGGLIGDDAIFTTGTYLTQGTVGFQRGSGDNLFVYVFDGNAGEDYHRYNGIFTDLNWHHFVFVFDGTQGTNANRVKVYKDNVLLTLTSTQGTFNTSLVSAILTIGDFNAINNKWLGQIMNLKIWNTVLTQAEINNDFAEFQQAKVIGNIVETKQNFQYIAGGDTNSQVILLETFADEGADGVSKKPRDWIAGTGVYNVKSLNPADAADMAALASGLFKKRDDKYIQASTAGTIKYPIDLASLAGNGYVEYLYYATGGAWVKRSGLINAPVTGVAYASSVLTFTTASVGDRIADIQVFRGIVQ